MTARCTKCNLIARYGGRGDKLADMNCGCGGEYEKVVWKMPSIYANNKGQYFKLEGIELKPCLKP